EEGQSVRSYVLKMKGYIDNLEHLGHPVTLSLGVSLILIGLCKVYDGFVQNYNMHCMGKTVNELHAMLELHEQTLPKSNAPALNAIRAGKVQKGNKHKKSQSQTAARGKNHGKGKNKQAYAPKPKIPPPPKRENPTKDSICHECGEIGHWKRNCPQYLAELLKKKNNAASGAGGSCIFVIELNIILNRSWIYDTGCGSHICNTTQGLRCYPKGIFEIDLSNSLTNENSIYAVSNKRAKLDLDFALLWHCRLGHISKKRIEKLQHDGLLDSSDLRAFERCVSCMSGKMARKPDTHQVERAKDLLGLIHTDVCGPFKIMSRQGASYFVTFTDDFSRYGYVYLLTHKHEVFETFKVFQKEVENQLGKTIKSLHSDHEGEYMSQEFLDHLKDHGIIAHRTPPYTSQHNGVSERINRTLLDMVRSMMSQTTLPKSFWDYALETVARILNMVPTKEVEKTPYENSLINQEASGSLKDLEIIQEEDTHPSLDTSLNHDDDDLEIDEPQSDIIPIRSKWLFKKKTDMDGNVHIYKAHLVAKGYTQTSGIDYEETFSPVTDIRAIRILIAIAAYYDYEIWQMDVKTAFLNGYLNEEEKLKLSKSQGASTPAELKRMQNVSYASAVGSIMYDVRCTRPDVAFAQNTGYVFILNGGAVDWKSAKQIIFATSSAEAEYIAAFYASKEAVWVRKFISGLGVVPTIEEPISMYCDNTGAIVIANESGITKGARHFCAKVHYLREVIEFGDIKLEKVHTDGNLADLFTKALAFPKHPEHTTNIGMLSASSLM
nr:retrotransposon protein, putative, Ty1-copia subclass [Tanacetum cinerariifolium]